MKRNIFLLILLLCFSSCKITKPSAEAGDNPVQTKANSIDILSPVINFSDQATWLLGYFKLRQLTSEPHSLWFIKGNDDYQPDPKVITRLGEIDKTGITIKIILGTWCPDSRREVPRFMKVLDLWHFPAEGVTFIGVDNAKLSPVGEYIKLDIQRVPTFILYKNNVEAGRIIENPLTSLEQDIENILTSND